MHSSRKWLVNGIIPVVFLLLAGGSPARAEEMTFPVVTGHQWVQSSQHEKLAYVNGMTTIIELEKEAQCKVEANLSGTSLNDGWVKGLAGLRLEDIVSQLDAYYRNNPTQANRPVVEVLWYEVASPNIARAR